MYVSELVCGIIIGAFVATALIVIAAIWYDKHDSSEE